MEKALNLRKEKGRVIITVEGLPTEEALKWVIKELTDSSAVEALRNYGFFLDTTEE